MKELNKDDLKFFTAAALQGLLANPIMLDKNYERQRAMKGLSLERIAVLSAVEVLQEIEIFTQAMDNLDKKKGLEVVPNDPEGPVEPNPS